MGLGNRTRGDDGAGCVVAERLARAGFLALDCAQTPENYIGPIARLRPTDIVLVDAVDFGGPAGSIELFGPFPSPEGRSGFDSQAVSTHSPGLGPVLEFLAGSCGAACWVLGVQPGRLCGGRGLSGPVLRAVEQIAASPLWAGTVLEAAR